MREIRDYLIDIKTECEYLMSKSKNLDYESFIVNEDLKRAFVRSLEIIGEASKHIPKELRRKYSQIRWKSVIGMRNILIHEYFGVDYRVLWKVIREKIPELYEVIKNMLEEVNKNE